MRFPGVSRAGFGIFVSLIFLSLLILVVEAGPVLPGETSRQQLARAASVDVASNLPRTKLPNIILIMTDDQGYGDLGIHGNKDIHTPNMDRLAHEGVRFENVYVSPVCSPTCASLLTGRYNYRTGVLTAHGGACILPPGEVTIAEVLKGAGYRTALVGKWHLGRSSRWGPLAQGFDDFLGFRDGMIDDYFDSFLEHNGRQAWVPGYITDVLTEAALRFIDENQKTPFFLYLAYNAPHFPIQVPAKYIDPYLKRGLPLHLSQMYGMISCVDDGIGRILARLKKVKLEENTVVFFLSDNGPEYHKDPRLIRRYDTLWRGVERYNANLRGQKGTVYEGGIKVPFFARWPGQFPAGKMVGGLAAHIDVFPTILDLCGISPPPGVKIDGKSLAKLLRQGKGPHEELFFRWEDVWKKTKVNPGFNFAYAVRSDPWKLLVHLGARDGGEELYNLDSDPFEKNNVADRHPKLVRKLQEAHDRWYRDVAPPEELLKPPIPINDEDTPSYIASNVFLGGTVLELSWAEVHGRDIRYEYDKLVRDRITGWTQPSDFIRWEIDVEREGHYQIILNYACPAADAGSRIRIEARGARLEAAVPDTPAYNVWKDWPVGSLHLRQGRSAFEIRALSVPSRSVMDLHEVRVRWVAKQ